MCVCPPASTVCVWPAEHPRHLRLRGRRQQRLRVRPRRAVEADQVVELHHRPVAGSSSRCCGSSCSRRPQVDLEDPARVLVSASSSSSGSISHSSALPITTSQPSAATPRSSRPAAGRWPPRLRGTRSAPRRFGRASSSTACRETRFPWMSAISAVRTEAGPSRGHGLRVNPPRCLREAATAAAGPDSQHLRQDRDRGLGRV